MLHNAKTLDISPSWYAQRKAPLLLPLFPAWALGIPVNKSGICTGEDIKCLQIIHPFLNYFVPRRSMNTFFFFYGLRGWLLFNVDWVIPHFLFLESSHSCSASLSVGICHVSSNPYWAARQERHCRLKTSWCQWNRNSRGWSTSVTQDIRPWFCFFWWKTLSG